MPRPTNGTPTRHITSHHITSHDAHEAPRGACMCAVCPLVLPFFHACAVNQDRPVLKYALGDDPTVCMFGVMDGHGEFGHQGTHAAQATAQCKLTAQ